MGSLKEFLAEEARKQGAESSDRDAIRNEWASAVDGLLSQIEDWIRAADEGGVLRVGRTPLRIREPHLGTYDVPGLRIAFRRREVEVVPVARYSIGSMVGDNLGVSIRNGRVDMSNRVRRFMLYRKSGAPGRDWIIVDDQDYIGHPLDRTRFEDALRCLLE